MQFESDVTLPSLTESTLLVSCVSVGNVGQLALDVILASLQRQGQFSLLSQVHHPCVIPMCGADPIVEVRLYFKLEFI